MGDHPLFIYEQRRERPVSAPPFLEPLPASRSERLPGPGCARRHQAISGACAATVLDNNASMPCPGEAVLGLQLALALKLVITTTPTGMGLRPHDPPRDSSGHFL